MRKRSFYMLALVCALSFFGCGRQGSDEIPTLSAPTTDVLNAEGADEIEEAEDKVGPKDPSTLEKAKALAQKLMGKAAQATKDGEKKSLFQSMENALGQAKIQIPKPGHDLKACQEDPSVLAFVMLKHRNTIHVCQNAASADPKALAQVLTHETAHVVGIDDECDATKTEVAVMRLSHANLAFRNGYMKPCRIR